MLLRGLGVWCAWLIAVGCNVGILGSDDPSSAYEGSWKLVEPDSLGMCIEFYHAGRLRYTGIRSGTVPAVEIQLRDDIRLTCPHICVHIQS